jgi:hypothetical protein
MHGVDGRNAGGTTPDEPITLGGLLLKSGPVGGRD